MRCPGASPPGGGSATDACRGAARSHVPRLGEVPGGPQHHGGLSRAPARPGARSPSEPCEPPLSFARRGETPRVDGLSDIMLSDSPRSTGRGAAYRSRLRSSTRRAAAADGLLKLLKGRGADVEEYSGRIARSPSPAGSARAPSPTTSASPPRSAAGRRARHAGSCCSTWTTSSGAPISCSARVSVRRQARTGPRSASRVRRGEPVERARRTERGTWDRTVATDDGVSRGLSAGREPGRGRDRAPLQPRGETSCTTCELR